MAVRTINQHEIFSFEYTHHLLPLQERGTSQSAFLRPFHGWRGVTFRKWFESFLKGGVIGWDGMNCSLFSHYAAVNS